MIVNPDMFKVCVSKFEEDDEEYTVKTRIRNESRACLFRDSLKKKELNLIKLRLRRKSIAGKEYLFSPLLPEGSDHKLEMFN